MWIQRNGDREEVLKQVLVRLHYAAENSGIQMGLRIPTKMS